MRTDNANITDSSASAACTPMLDTDLNPYEAEREARLRENQAKLKAIGIVPLPKLPKTQRSKRTRLALPPRELSLRTRNATVSYKESPELKSKRNMGSTKNSQDDDINYFVMPLADYLKGEVNWPSGTEALDKQLEEVVGILQGANKPGATILTPEDLRTWDWPSLSQCLEERGLDGGVLTRFRMWKEKAAGPTGKQKTKGLVSQNHAPCLLLAYFTSLQELLTVQEIQI